MDGFDGWTGGRGGRTDSHSAGELLANETVGGQ